MIKAWSIKLSQILISLQMKCNWYAIWCKILLKNSGYPSERLTVPRDSIKSFYFQIKDDTIDVYKISKWVFMLFGIVLS
jgi:hypothetical protein